jgi:hypothetical protein
VQQNHDGLPQKANMPQKDINEIHGSWYDPTNFVVPMDGTLRGDLCEWRDKWTTETDLVLVLGTSLAGMSTDNMVHTVSKKAASGVAIGSVIISIQCTPHDKESSLRIFCKLDEVFELLAKEMSLKVAPLDAPLPSEPKEVFMVPYDRAGKLLKDIKDTSKYTKLDLSKGARVMQTQGHFRGALGTVIGRNDENHFIIEFEEVENHDGAISVTVVKRLFGLWWGKTLERGEVAQMPIRNHKVEMSASNNAKSEEVKSEEELEKERAEIEKMKRGMLAAISKK